MKNLNFFGCFKKPCCLHLQTPTKGQSYETLPAVQGVTYPGEELCIGIDHHPPFSAVADQNGFFCAANPYDLAPGMHFVQVKARQSGCFVCRRVFICTAWPLAPTVDSPVCGTAVSGTDLHIRGRAHPGFAVRVCLQGYGCQTTHADRNGVYEIAFGISPAAGDYTLRVWQISPCGEKSPQTVCRFTVEPAQFHIEPVDLRMGNAFRTVDADVQVTGGFAGPATVYYLLLPPGSPAPSTEEIMHFTNTGALLDGTAATGRFETVFSPDEKLYSWALTGLDNPNAPEGATGVIDGYRYDAYLVVVAPPHESGVLSFGKSAMGMPFSSGLGTEEDPFTIRELTGEQLQNYPDLLAENALNEPGVDETARMLENIERLITLFERTDGLYGLETSMQLAYQMISNIDLVGYAAAYNGEGWQPIGDIDGWINGQKETEHLFSGVFDGAAYTISNLQMTPTADADSFVGYRGLFGGVQEGTLRNLTLSGVQIDAFASPPGQAQFGSFISIARRPVLQNLTLQNAEITADIGEILVGDTHAVNIGGFVGEIFEGGIAENITGQNITIAVPERSALALGGFVGFTDKFEAYESYKNITLTGVNLSGYQMIGGLAGYMTYGVNNIDNASVRQISITAPGGEAGGLIGRLYIYSDTGECLIQNSEVKRIFVFGAPADSGSVGGLVGLAAQNPFARGQTAPRRIFAREEPAVLPGDGLPGVTIQNCSAREGSILCGFDGGGLIGRVQIARAPDAKTLVTHCKADLAVSTQTENAGGLVGFGENLRVQQSFAAAGLVLAPGGVAGGIIAFAENCILEDSYATGTKTGLTGAGSLVGTANETEITRCYQTGNVTAENTAGGTAALSLDSHIRNNLVLGGAISAETAHRILGTDTAGSILSQNYARDTTAPVPAAPNPDGPDGGTITSMQIVPTMQNLGWNTATIWDEEAVTSLGRPTLMQNPE